MLERMLAFLDEVGIAHRFATLPDDTFLPGLSIDGGTLLIDRARLRHPGDVLHEAGHIAVAAPAERLRLDGDAGTDVGYEVAAILWSYAALREIGLAPDTVFHPDGYQGVSDWFIDTLTSGTYPGLPLLEWMGLTSTEQFPAMTRWLRVS